MIKTWEEINKPLYRRKKNLKNTTQLKDLNNMEKIVEEAS